MSLSMCLAALRKPLHRSITAQGRPPRRPRRAMCHETWRLNELLDVVHTAPRQVSSRAVSLVDLWVEVMVPGTLTPAGPSNGSVQSGQRQMTATRPSSRRR